MTVKQIANKFNLWGQIELAVKDLLEDVSTTDFLVRIGEIPIKSSWSTRRLGAYVYMGGKPVCIRLQLAQEAENLQQTFLHEVAHACDHLSKKGGQQPYRLAHGPSWKNWAKKLGTSPQRYGESSAIMQLHQQRMKLVARCKKCGYEIHRVRRLNRNRVYFHNGCGGKIEQV